MESILSMLIVNWFGLVWFGLVQFNHHLLAHCA
jgi:hypothetical protein